MRPLAKQVIRNGLFNASGWLITIALSIVSTPFFVTKLTLEGYGLYALTTGIVGYYSLLDLGLGQAIIKFVAQHRARNETRELHASINSAATVQFLLGLTGSLIVVAFSRQLLEVLNVPDHLKAEALSSLYFCAAGFFMTMVTTTFSSVLNGIQRYDITARTNIIMGSASITTTAVVLYFGYGLREAVAVTVGFSVLSGCVYFVVLKRLLPSWSLAWNLAPEMLSKLFSFSGFVFVAQLSSFVSSYLVRIVISMILGPAAVTLFVIPSKLTSAFGGLLSSGFSVLFPTASALNAADEKEKIQRGFLEGSRLFASICVPVLLLLFVFAEPVLALWMGGSFADEASGILRVISFASLVGSVTTVPNMMTLGMGHSRIIALFSIATLTSYLISLPLMTWLYGVPGTAWAMLFSTAPGVVLVLVEAKKIFNVASHLYAWRIFSFHVIPLMLALAVSFFAILPLSNVGVYVNLAICLTFCGVYLVAMITTKWLPLRKYLSL